MPLNDVTFATSLPSEMTTSGPFAGAVCAAPPPVQFGGTVTRCIDEP